MGSNQTRTRALLIGLIALGAGLRIWQYAADTSFWFDELSIARNLGERSLIELLRSPLSYDQMAPVGFLGLEKITLLVLGSSDLALRLPVFLVGVAALALFWRTSVRALDGVAVPIAVGLFAIGIPFIRYSTELKHYGLEIASAILLTGLALDLRAPGGTTRRCVTAGLAGFVAVWFSQAAILVLAGLGAGLTLCWAVRREPALRRAVMITVPIWAVSSACGFASALLHSNPSTVAFMHVFWGVRNGYPPVPFSLRGDALWLWTVFNQFFSEISLLRYPLGGCFTALALLGFGILWRQRREVAILLLGPMAVTLAASITHQFPFRFRLVLVLLPAMVIALAAAIAWIGAQAARAHRAIGAAVVLALLIPPALAIAAVPPPIVVEAFKPVLAHVRAHLQAGDAVYVYANTYQAVDRYGPGFGLPPGSYVSGICDQRDVRPYLADVDRFRGAARLWVIGSSVPGFRHPRNEIARYLQTIGVRRDSIRLAPSPITLLDPVSAELYDLSDPARLRSAALESFATAPFPNQQRPLCRDWIRPAGPAR